MIALSDLHSIENEGEPVEGIEVEVGSRRIWNKCGEGFFMYSSFEPCLRTRDSISDEELLNHLGGGVVWSGFRADAIFFLRQFGE